MNDQPPPPTPDDQPPSRRVADLDPNELAELMAEAHLEAMESWTGLKRGGWFAAGFWFTAGGALFYVIAYLIVALWLFEELSAN